MSMFKTITLFATMGLAALAQTGITPGQVKTETPPEDVTVGTKRATLIIDGKFYLLRLGPSFVFTLDNGELVMDVVQPTMPAPKVINRFYQVVTAATATSITLGVAGSQQVDPATVRYFRNGLLQSETDFTLNAATGVLTLTAAYPARAGDIIVVYWSQQ